MSTPVYPRAVWDENTLQNDVPANDNSLRDEAFGRKVISDSTTAQPGSPADGDVYIIPASATGTQWATFTTGDVALYRGGTWYALAPVAGVFVNVNGTLKQWTGSAWTAFGSGTDRSAVSALSIASGVVNIDCALGDFFTLALTANVTSITFSNLPASGHAVSIAVRMRQDGTGSRTVALPASFKAITGSDTAVQSPANAYTVLMITTFDQGTRWEYSMKGGTA